MAGAIHARVEDGHVELFIVELPAQGGAAVHIRHVELMRFGAQLPEGVARIRCARRGDDSPASVAVLTDELVADAARGADDQCGRHVFSPWKVK